MELATILASDNDFDHSTSARSLAPVALVGALAVLMGLPALGGSFVGGDDHRLLLNHVLVNHPSFEHAVEIFTIWHRDLYQPLALLSFQAEFAIANAFGLFDAGVSGGAWLFHLTNILLHAANSILVWFLIRNLHERVIGKELTSPASTKTVHSPWDSAGGRAGSARVVATIAGIIFAVHPLQTEVVAWTNGRMMLLSTFFALLSLMSFSRLLDGAPKRTGVYTAVFSLLSALSKVRISLPILLLIVFLVRRGKLNRRAMSAWLACTMITAVFVVVNVLATSNADLFAAAAERLEGSRIVRVGLALGCYVQHFLWPTGLSSFYPTPAVVAWTDPATWRAFAIVVPMLSALGWLCRYSLVARYGLLWFAATIAATLPLIPARNVLAADRYIYLPMVGLAWVFAVIFCRLVRPVLATGPWGRGATLAVSVSLVAGSIGMCWHVASFYRTPLQKTMRVAQLFPNAPRVWEPLGWTYHGAGRYEEALTCARKELSHGEPAVRSRAYQLLGMATLKLGSTDEALGHLREAIRIAPESAIARYRLAQALEELNRVGDALAWYEGAVELAPGHNPTILRLANVYRKLGRVNDARQMYEQALANNPQYEVGAIMALVDLDLAANTKGSNQAAAQRLESLLAWMPENVSAWTNLGVARHRLGQSDMAIECYVEALERDSGNIRALLNLAQLYVSVGNADQARRFFKHAQLVGLETVRQAQAVHDFHVSRGAIPRAVALWESFSKRNDDPEAEVFLAWSYALGGHLRAAFEKVDPYAKGGSPLALATVIFVHLAEGSYPQALEEVTKLSDLGAGGQSARRRLLTSLERIDRAAPNVPWTFCVAAELLLADDGVEAARMSVDLCKERCEDDVCRDHVLVLRKRLEGPSGMTDTP